MDESSRTVGAIIKLRKTLIEQGEQEIKKNIEPYVSKHLQDAYPRVHKGYYSTLIWFTLQVK